MDIAAIATNAAANLYAQSDGAIQVLAVNTLGVLYILEKGDTVHSMADLSGGGPHAGGAGEDHEVGKPAAGCAGISGNVRFTLWLICPEKPSTPPPTPRGPTRSTF